MSGDGGDAFPWSPGDFSHGMTLRDWFAGQALAGMLAFDGYSSPVTDKRITSEIFADSAYELADAMLKERSESDA